MATPDYATWFTKQQAADAIGVSTKTVEQLAKDRKVEQARWRRPEGGPELAVYHPDDVARIAQERHQAPAPFVLPAVPATGNGNGQGSPPNGLARTPNQTGADADPLRALAGAFVALLSEKSQNSEKSQKGFLTIPEAAAATGLSR